MRIPEPSLVLLIGPSGAGKSTFAHKHFKPTEILSSDFCRGLVSDDETDQTATNDAFEVLHFIAAKRLAAGKLTVIDATNVQAEARKPLVALAREYHCLTVAIVFNIPAKLCQERNEARPDRDFKPHVIRQQCQQLRRSLRTLKREGFRNFLYMMSTPEALEAVHIERQPLWVNRTDEQGPFDIIGDIHGCFDELVELLKELGYTISTQPDGNTVVAPPQGRKAVFVGDFVDRGPKVPEVLRLVMQMQKADAAICVPGNHDVKLVRALRGKNVKPTHGLAESLAQLEKEPAEFKTQIAEFLDGLVSHYVLDNGKLVVAHAGMKTELQGRASGRVREFALYGETTGETDEFGLPIRLNWADEYRGAATVVYGHTPVPEPQWVNRTINIDTGCVFGGKLTALQYPEKALVSVPAHQTYYQPAKPFLADESQRSTKTHAYDDILNIDDVLGKRVISTRLHHNVTIREENTITALETISRFAVDPKWLIYLPPTMSPTETTNSPGLLEYPAEAFAYYRKQGISNVVWEEKHMGSRAVVIVCRDPETAKRRFGVADDTLGICYTRTGRRFFDDTTIETELLKRVKEAMDKADYWETLNTDWICLDCELMPWSVKAQELLRQQYAPVGTSARVALGEAVTALETAAEQGIDVNPILENYRQRAEAVTGYVKAYQQYCWHVQSIADLKLAPFHLLATEGTVYFDKDHLWHMETLGKLCENSEGNLLFTTSYGTVDVTDDTSQTEAIHRWEELTEQGGEGTVIKPLDFIVKGKRGLVQPAVKCRGREYLRIIYGPEYTLPQNLERLRSRGLSHKRSLALREFALGVEALERFVHREPLSHVHECVFGILALESEAVDPRL
ncbi:polynucleotide kinase-phosphatase [Candidatus Poribacteria bacterium]|nr:polynucleotide kinase-phosphatase [Candidatus Poribacteria bacterium]MYB00772.1 polynucleotide kinase-phosphatase [Candidatus Poribacteria bacterium]